MPTPRDTAFIVYDTESVVDGALLSKTCYPGEDLPPDDAVARYRDELRERQPNKDPFIPVTFQVPVAIGVARVGPDFRLQDLRALDAEGHDPQQMVKDFWRGLEYYEGATLVDFNGRGFDLPLMTMSAFRFGISCPRYFHDPDRFGFRYRFTHKHIDLMDWMTEYGAYRLVGGLNLLAKILGKPGKMGTTGANVEAMHAEGQLQEISDYCLHDVLDTYFAFLRTRVLTGHIDLEREQEIVSETKVWLQEKAESVAALEPYLANFGDWDGRPFVE